MKHLFLFDVDGVLVEARGYLLMRVMHRREDVLMHPWNYLYIDQISVEPAQQGKGYGKALMETAGSALSVCANGPKCWAAASSWKALRAPERPSSRRFRMAVEILLADDHGVLRAGLRALLNAEQDLSVVGEAATGDEALRLAAELQPVTSLRTRDGLLMVVAAALLTGVAVELLAGFWRGIWTGEASTFFVLTNGLLLILGCAGMADLTAWLTEETGVVLVLKGAPTVVAGPDGEVWINPTGNAGLAT